MAMLWFVDAMACTIEPWGVVPMTSVIIPVNEGFAKARDNVLSKTTPWNKRSPINIRTGRRLQLRRISCGISEKEFGEQSGIARDDLHLYESGEKRVSSNLLLQLGKLLEARLEYFFEDNPALARP
jgi:DNA-binding XRE family transcriptional regulator